MNFKDAFLDEVGKEAGKREIAAAALIPLMSMFGCKGKTCPPTPPPPAATASEPAPLTDASSEMKQKIIKSMKMKREAGEMAISAREGYKARHAAEVKRLAATVPSSRAASKLVYGPRHQ